MRSSRTSTADGQMFSGGRGVIDCKRVLQENFPFDKPIERVVIAAANPIATFQNSDHAQQLRDRTRSGPAVWSITSSSMGNYTFVDSKISLLPEQRNVQTSLRAAARRSIEEPVQPWSADSPPAGFSTRVLFNYFGDRISDVGANQAPDIIEQGRGSLDLVFGQRVRGLGIRLTLENLTNSDYLFTQTLSTPETQQLFQTRTHHRVVVRLQRVLRPKS